MAKDPDTRHKLLELLAENPSISAACRKLGINRMMFYRLLKSDADFKASVKLALVDGRAQWIEIAELGLMKEVKEGNVGAIKYFLSNNSTRYAQKNTIDYIPPEGRDTLEQEKKEAARQPAREETVMPDAVNDQWQNLEKLGMLTSEPPAPDPTVLEMELEHKEEEEEQIHNAELAEQEKEEQKKRELAEILLNFERAQRARMIQWPDQALAFPIEVRIKNYRETWGKGEAAMGWDISWYEHKGNKNPSPI